MPDDVIDNLNLDQLVASAISGKEIEPPPQAPVVEVDNLTALFRDQKKYAKYVQRVNIDATNSASVTTASSTAGAAIAAITTTKAYSTKHRHYAVQ